MRSIPQQRRASSRLRKTILAALTAGSLALTGCSAFGGGEEAPPDADRPLVIAQPSDVLGLDPSVDTSPISQNVFYNVFDRLTNISPKGEVEPNIATKWEPNDDATVWTFTIRKGVKFSDGSDLSLDDIVWSYESIMANPKSPRLSYLTWVKSIKKVGDDKIEFTLNSSFAPFDRQASLISILPQDYYEKVGAQEFALNPVGSGPYKVVKWVKDDHVELTINDQYWGDKPSIKTVMIRPVPSESSRASGLETGELDIVPNLPPASVERLGKLSNAKIVTVASNRVVYLGFNQGHPALNQSMRLAMDMAIDRKAITEKLLSGLGVPESQIIAPVSFGYDSSIKPTAYDAEKAKSLVKESGYDGSEIVFQYPNNMVSLGTEVAQAVAGYWKDAGINVKMEGMEYTAFYPLWLGSKLSGIHMFAYSPSILDGDLPLNSIFVSKSKGYWNNPQVDALIKEERSNPNPAERKKAMSQIWKMTKEQAAYSFLYNEVQAYGVNNVVDWKPRPDSLYDLSSMKYAKAK